MEPKTTSGTEVPIGLVYAFFALLILALAAWSFVRAMRANDTTQVNVDIPGQGSVNLSLRTNPYPPLPSGTVELNLMGMDSRNVMADLGPEVPFTFGPQGSDYAQGSGSAAAQGDGNYRAGVMFSVPGTYWLLFDLGGGRTARFQVRVEPAQ